MISLIIDNREKKLIEYFKSNTIDNTAISIEQLSIGDLIFKKDDEIILIIERKTIGDLYSSINDGRYKEQKIRLLKNYKLEQICYLIEGTVEKYNTKFTKNIGKAVYGSIINTTFRDNIKILRTYNIDETITILINISKKINNNLDFFIKTPNITNTLNSKSDNVNSNDSSEYINSIKLKKKDNLTPEIYNNLILMQIPGVSQCISKCILEKYVSIKDLILLYDKMQNDITKYNLLKDLEFSIQNNKKRKIGPVVSKRIYDFFYGNCDK
jgi:crossover junction endonuclease MUS81